MQFSPIIQKPQLSRPAKPQLMVIRPHAGVGGSVNKHLDGTFAVEVASINDIGERPLGRNILLDVDLADEALVLKLKEWLKAKPSDANVVFAIDGTSHLQAIRASALGATAVVRRPLGKRNLAVALAKCVSTREVSQPVSNRSIGVLGQSIEAGTGCLASIFAAAGDGQVIEPSAMAAAGEAIISDIEDQGLSRWIEAVRAHHSQTYQHCLLVTGVAAAFGQRLGLSRADRLRLATAGMLHDIGKARIPLAILEKPGPLTEQEREVIKHHPEYGAEALAGRSSIDAEMIDMVIHHHEYIDGSGYPHGLIGNEIQDFVRIMTICDVFGALMEKRAYKPPLSAEEAYNILRQMDRQLDQDLVRAFASVSATM